MNPILQQKIWSRVAPDPNTGCWLFVGFLNGDGYGRLWADGRSRTAHRVAYEAYVGPIAPGLGVLHRCDTPACCNPDHLFAGTQATNRLDCIAKCRDARGDRNGARRRPERLARGERHGSRTMPERIVRGERHGMAKLSDADVDVIRAAYAAGDSRAELARRFGISTNTVFNIGTGRSRKRRTT